MAALRPHCVVKSDRLLLEDDRLREGCYYEALVFSQHSINLELNEESMKPEKATKAPRNAGIDSSTMKMKQWFQGKNRVSDESQWQWPSNCVIDKKAPTGTERASYQDTASISGTYPFAKFIAPVESVTFTKHVWGNQVYQSWSSSCYYVSPYPQMLQGQCRNKVSK